MSQSHTPSLKNLTRALRSAGKETGARTRSLEAAPAGERDYLTTLKASLQAAITLEFSTVPLYLCALWSIKDDLHPVAVSIREVVQEEMLHMSLACNMLAALGGSPQITAAVPSYPGPLPGGVHKGLVAKFSGLTRDVLKDFMWIERPVKAIPHDHPYEKPGDHDAPEGPLGDEDETIGDFYEAIKDVFVKNQPELSPDNQITGPLAWTVTRNVDDVVSAINLITTQGEGSTATPAKERGGVSHYYRFLEAFEDVELSWDPVKSKLSHGKPIPFPEGWNMGVVPEGGYLKDQVSADVWHYVDKFDDTFTRLLDLLQGAWCRGGQASFIHAIAAMFELEKYAKPLMQIPIPGDEAGKTYGPCFRYKTHS